MALGDEVVMDAPCGPLALPPQGVDLGDQIGVADPPARPALGSTACFTVTSVSTPAAPVWDLP
ncbi:hypothetical protein D9B85_12800, partial [Corynebacterium diphtheriae]